MKQIMVFLVLMIIGCKQNYMHYPLVVDSVESTVTSGLSTYKYRVHIRSTHYVGNETGIFYTDTLYQVGDTLK